MKIEWVNVEKLNGVEYNPRKISKTALNKLKEMIQEDKKFLELRPCLVNDRDGKLIVYAGNQRLKAAKELGWKQMPCIIEKIDEKLEKERNLKDNKSAGDWDWNLLSAFDLEVLKKVGFSDDELKKLNKDESEKPEVEFTEELLEEHNYVIFYFDNVLDWNVCVEKFGIKPVKALDSKEGYQRIGIGRVLSGKKLLGMVK